MERHSNPSVPNDVLYFFCHTIVGDCKNKLLTQFLTECDQKFPGFADEVCCSNTTPGISLASKAILSILYSAILLTSLVGNSLVILAFLTNRHMRSVTNAFILSLAVSDIMVTVACVPFNMGEHFTHYWIFGAFACKMVPFVSTFCVASNSLTLCCIAFDRYYAIVYPLKRKFWQTPQRAFFLLLVVWILSAASSVPNAIYYKTEAYFYVCHREHKAGPVYNCRWPNSKYRPLLAIWLPFVLLFVTPVMIMSVNYGIIAYRLWVKKPIGARGPSGESARIKMKKKAIKMLITIVLLYLFCWSPLFIYNAVSLEMTATETNLTWKEYLQCLAISSCCWNPIVYAFLNVNFRKNFARVLYCTRNRVLQEPSGRGGVRVNIQEARSDTEVISRQHATEVMASTSQRI